MHQRNDVSPWPFVGMAGMATTFFLYAASGLIAPWWAALLLMALWVWLLVVATRWWTPRPTWVPVLPVVLVVVWFAVGLGGGLLLDWEPWWEWSYVRSGGTS